MPRPLLAPLALLACLASANAADPPESQRARTAFLSRASGKDGSFRKESGKQWVETTADGGQLQFEEVARTPQYVELFDSSRTMWLRLYSDHVEWRQGKNPQWFRLCDGRWVRPDELPRPPRSDYRIRLAYFLPTDRKPTPDYAAKIRVVMQLVAEVYRQDFEARGIRSEGLRFEARDGQPVVHLIPGRRAAAFYHNDPNNQWKHILAEIPTSVGVPGKNVIVVFAETYDSGPAPFEWPGGVALGGRFSSEGVVGLFSAWILRSELEALGPRREALAEQTVHG